ncbi:hypothetical protein DAPPUDRAFT_106758 [Daphnia pulex]|uniref:Uncharacterized protein n=1 Tax=Daphnia pulex TaxID=6669 RepID=E9GUI1_DAPPU|nr:hypothetical protein DAPPUDRAFT_106758 [Daphnia pulex]|eukprot:EFX76844.1 hypothetical protein DAPPUDRAFT_106758 [Daphnia pulex]
MEEVNGVQVPVLHTFYMDHVIENENKQDVTAVFSVLEAILMRLKAILPHLKTVYLQSDNAGCYQNTLMVFILPHLSYVHGVCIRRFIHTETQDGKSVLDAHFARSSQIVDDLSKEGNDVVTPTQLVTALKSYGGLENCVAELISLKSGRLNMLRQACSSLEKKVKRFNSDTFPLSPNLCPSATIGTGIKVIVTPGAEKLSSESEADDSDSGDNGAHINEIQLTNAVSSPIVAETSVPCELEARGTREGPVNETGFVTEVLVYTDRQLRRRANRWKKKMKITKKKKQDGTSNGMKQKTTDDVYVTFLKALAADQPNLLPAKALQLTIEHFPAESVERQNPHPSVEMLFSIHPNPLLVSVKLATSFFSLCFSCH